MAYIDETYGKQLEEALRGLVSRPALGQLWFGFHKSEVPAGVLLFTATTHSRVLYADFWKYIQDKNLVKTEEEWQSIYNKQGWCPFYSDGDGIDTFRMPSAPLYLHGASTLGEASQYIEAGLPNITGYMDLHGSSVASIVYSTSGAFVGGNGSATTYRTPAQLAEQTGASSFGFIGFDASRLSPIYGNSDTVTPETSKMLFGVWAISVPQQPIPDATVEGIISELGVASNNALEAKNSLNKIMPVGTVMAFAANSIPEGFLLCNGAAVSRTTYAKLFETIGTIYGAGDGSTTFNLPDTQSRVIEGQGGSPVGTYWEPGLPNITGTVTNDISNAVFHDGQSGAFYASNTGSSQGGTGITMHNVLGISMDASRVNSIYGRYNTVQPAAVTMRYYIKY